MIKLFKPVDEDFFEWRRLSARRGTYRVINASTIRRGW